MQFRGTPQAVGFILVALAMLYGAFCATLFLKCWYKSKADPRFDPASIVSPHQFYVGLVFVIVIGCQFFAWVFGIDLGPGVDEWM